VQCSWVEVCGCVEQQYSDGIQMSGVGIGMLALEGLGLDD